jgi:hypothetical protein
MNFNLDGFAVMLPALALLWAVNKKGNARGKSQTVINVAKMFLALAAGCGMVYTFLGSGLAAGIGWVSGMSPALKVGVPLALVLAAGGLAILDIAIDRTADKGAQVAAILTPTFLALVVAGSLGLSGGNAVHDAYQQLHAQVVKIGGRS